MSLKVMSLVTIMLCGLLTGLEFKRRLSVRVQSLEMFRTLFWDMRSMVAHSGLTLEDMIWDLSERRADNPFLSKMRELTSQVSFREAWRMSLKALRGALCLTDDDMMLLQSCADSLGKSDVEGELHALALINERVTAAMEGARDKLNSDGKVYTAVGSSCGIILALLLI